MKSDISKLEILMKKMQNLGVAELHFEDGDTVIHLTNAAHIPALPKADIIEPPEQFTSQHTIKATMYGQFYAAPSPAEPPFVRPGDTVRAGHTLYILEVMKTLSRVDAEFPCRILTIPQTDGQTVEPGTPLFIVEMLNV